MKYIIHPLVLSVLCGLMITMSLPNLFANDAAIRGQNWQLDGTGREVEPGVFEVTGNGSGASYWYSEPVKLQPGAFYRFTVSIRGENSEGGCLPCGLEGFSRDFTATKNEWKEESFCFRTPDSTETFRMKIGQWESSGTFQFRDMKLEQVVPVLKEFDLPFGKITLGEGETIKDGKYTFNGNFSGPGTSAHRLLSSSPKASFNTDRWCFGQGSDVLCSFRLASITGKLEMFPLQDGKISLNVNHHTGGEGCVKVWDFLHEDWQEIGRFDKTGTVEFTLSEGFFPADVIAVKIQGLEGSHFQVNRIGFEASLPKTYRETNLDTLNHMGETLFATLDAKGEQIPTDTMLTLTKNNEIRAFKLINGLMGSEKLIPLNGSRSPGEMEQTFEFDGRTYTLTTQTHPLHRSDYGYVLPMNRMASSGTYWWCEADWKVGRDRMAPEVSPETAKPIQINAAKNDVEGFQFVVRANDDTPIKGLTGKVGELKGPGGAVIPAENVELLYAYYHFVHSKTDATGIVDFWPDALPPLDRPIDIDAGKNQPIWINVKVPDDAVPGDYEGTFQLASEDGKFRVAMPYKLHVWNFALPKENHYETAYGYNPHQAARYHNAQTDEDRRRVNEMYLQCFSDHRISIYNPAPFNGIAVKWLPEENPPRCEIDFSRYEAEMDRVMEKYHFTNFTVPGHGLGGGTFHARTDPSLAGFAADTPEYKAMMTDYYTKLQNFLERKGWLDKAYIYWFDEPGKHDYEFVADGTARIQKYGPKIQRFMTLMMDNDGFMNTLEEKNTSINIWCSISNSFRDELAKQRMALGERFWWYVCTGPKAPYCTLFLDHPATELRIWHWQAWQRNVVGSLVWESTYWHSATAFPDSFQNPYEDPMGYTVGYSVPSGTKQHWGNGDGRFIYPPLSAAIPGMNDGKPVFDKPVSSVRWEMIREGVEDYEMLYLLRELIRDKGDALSEFDRQAANALLEVPESITKSMTEFTIDPRPVLQRRTAVAETIEKLSML